MMARSSKAPSMGRIQKRKTNFLQIIIFALQRAAGPYRGAMSGPFKSSALTKKKPRDHCPGVLDLRVIWQSPGSPMHYFSASAPAGPGRCRSRRSVRR